MSDVDTLIERLVAQHRRTPPHRLFNRVATAAIVGGAVTLLVVMIWGFRPDMTRASATPAFWIKLGLGGGCAVAGLAGLLALFRPERTAPHRLWLTAAPMVAICVAAAHEAAIVSNAELVPLWLGRTALVCPFAIAALSLFPAIALTMAGRRCAPTRLRLTGGFIGFASGGLAATFYALHCPESGMSFVASWYLLGVLLATLIGAMCGPRMLRW